MVRGLGLEITIEQAPFEPEAGAYSHSHSGGHTHEHSHKSDSHSHGDAPLILNPARRGHSHD
jgi:urease accessory protein